MVKFLLTLLSFTFFSQAFTQGGFGQLGAKKYNHVYGVIVGISDYSEIKDLTYADADAKLMYDLLCMSFPEEKANFQLITNEKAAQTPIKRAIFDVCKKAEEGDLVILYFSGHGDVMSIYGTDYGYFLAYDASKSREYEAGGTIEFEFVNRHMNGVASSKKCDVWLITDACRAGKVVNQQGAQATMTTLNQSFLHTTKFISCQATELSYEDESLQHGVFTYYLTKGMSGEANSDENEGTLTIDEINSYLKSSVRKYTTGKQTPKASSPNEFAPFFTPNKNIAALVTPAANASMEDMASRGKGLGDAEKTRETRDIENAIANNDLRESSNSAYSLLKNYQSSLTANDYAILENQVVDALASRGQRVIKLFLAGRSTIGNKENFESAIADFQLAMEIVGKDHFLWEELNEKKEFLNCLKVIQKEDFKAYTSSESKLLALQKANPVAAYLNEGLALLYMKMGQNEKATAQSKIANEKVNTWSKPQNTAAHIQIVSGNLDKAQELLDKINGLENNQENVAVLTTELKTANWELQIAEEEFKKIDPKNSAYSPSELLLIEAKIQKLKGRITVAESLYKKALVEDPKNIEITNLLGDLYKKDGDTINALKYYQKSQEIEPNEIYSSMQIAVLKNTTSTKKSPENFYNTQQILAFVDQAIEKKDYSTAISLLKTAQKNNPSNADLDYALGKCYYENGKKEEAETSLKNALKKNPFHFETIQALTNLYIIEKRFPDAEQVLKENADKFKYSAKYRVFVYNSYDNMKKTNNAIFILQEAIRLDSTDTEAYKSLYRLYMKEGNFRAAEKEFIRLRKMGGRMKDSTEFMNELIYTVENRIDRGMKDYKSTEGLKLILKYDKYFLTRMTSEAQRLYLIFNYRMADIELEHYAKFTYCMQQEDINEYMRIKARLMLEVGMYREALDLYRQLNEKSRKTCYLGVAMAQYELGMTEQVWLSNFVRDNDTRDFNEKALERFQKMNRSKGHYSSGY